MIHVARNIPVQIALLVLLLALPAAGANWTNYVDDFSTNQVETDAVLHSAFCESDANPASEPCLQYHETPDKGLVFRAYDNRPAELGYILSYDAAQSRRMIAGTFTLDVSFPCDPYVSQFPPGELFYATSPDGFAWSENQPLWDGRQTIPFSSTEGKCYVRLRGDRAKIDNVRISLSSPPATIRVPGGGRIQQAIDAARDDDVIEVAPGTYTGAGNWDLDFRGKRITLRSASGPQSTTILCGPGHRGFYFHQGETSESVLSGFTIRGGRLSGSTSLGGGIYCEAASPTILHCIIDDCVAGLGGGIACVGGGPIVSGCVIRSNSATSAGAGVYLLDSMATIAGCTIASNTASGSAQGGGVYCLDSSEVRLNNCVISGNSAAAGAGVCAEQFAAWGPRSRVSIVNCTIVQNRLTSANSAGGVDAGEADVEILNSIIWDNHGTAVVSSYAVDVSYSDIQGAYPGPGNISVNPLFADADYHLSAQSPCLDAGDPSSSFAAEPAPNGGRINMGAYGGTTGAERGAERTVYHVNVKIGRNSYDSGSQMRPFASIQAAINAARDGATILVWPGVYYEDITFLGKAITVRSAGDAAVITASRAYGCTFNMAEGSDSVLANFVITGCVDGGIFCDGASPTLKNLTIVKNSAGIVLYGGADPSITNCIIWENVHPINKRNVSLSPYMASYAWKISYSCIDVADAGKVDWKAGNIRSNPLFANAGGGDYHLRSQYGRYMSLTGTWALDSNAISPCIDAGDPSDDPHSEPMGNGNLINMGAYGGTRYASKSGLSPCP